MSRARARLTEARELARAAGDRKNEANWLGNLAYIDLDEGRVERAAEAFIECSTVHRELKSLGEVAIWQFGLSEAWWRMGRREEALSTFEGAKGLIESVRPGRASHEYTFSRRAADLLGVEFPDHLFGED